MDANLAGEEVAPRRLSFPYSNWGPTAAVLGVILALGAGVVMGVPAAIIGFEHGSVSRFDPTTGAKVSTFGDGDSSALAVAGSIVYADRETEVEVFGSDGEATTGSPFGEFGASRGLAFDRRDGKLLVADEADGSIGVYSGGAEPKLEKQLRSGPGLAPEAIAVDEEAEGVLGSPSVVLAIDRRSDSVVRFGLTGGQLGAIDAADSPDRKFDFGNPGENGVAVDNSGGPGDGNVYVLAGANGGTVLAFDRSGSFLWQLESSDDREFCGVAVDPAGKIWLADPDGGVDQYAARAGDRPPLATGRSLDTDSDSCAIAFDGGGSPFNESKNAVFVAREADGKLSTGANILVQLATALGFLLVPFAIAVWRGAAGVGEAAARLGIRPFRPSALKWMAAAIGAYLVFTALYVSLIGEPHQEDIAKGFGVLPIQVLLIVIAAPISEEVCFRGMLYGGLRERLPRIAAALIAGVIFGGLHALTGISAVPPLIVFGFLLSLLYEKTGSIVPGIILHMLNNCVALLGQ